VGSLSSSVRPPNTRSRTWLSLLVMSLRVLSFLKQGSASEGFHSNISQVKWVQYFGAVSSAQRDSLSITLSFSSPSLVEPDVGSII
jgi:hypothetical protein